MNPPSPPFECAHMWGPSLVASLKDLSLHNSLRQPALDLIQTIMVSDAAALVASTLRCPMPLDALRDMDYEPFDEENDDAVLFTNDLIGDASCWNEFCVQSKVICRESGEWMSIPMLWFDVFVEIDPFVLPVSFSKAACWALSRFSMVEPGNSTETILSVETWLSTFASDISDAFGWNTVSSFDDYGEWKVSKNSIRVSTMFTPLIRTFKKLTAHFIAKMEQGELWKRWIWEPRMSDSLILLLVDPNDVARQVGKRILEQVSNTRGLTSSLQFLCSSLSSLSALFLGFRHALKQVQADSVLPFQALHHLFFVLCKILKEGIIPSSLPRNSSCDSSNSSFCSQGGFLRLPTFNHVAGNANAHSNHVDLSSWKEFNYLLSANVWPYIQKCLSDGKTSINCKASQMTCIRLLEVLPVIVERLHPFIEMPAKSRTNIHTMVDYKWLHDLMLWGNSSHAVVVRYWKQTVISMLTLFKMSCSPLSVSTSVIGAMEKLISQESIAVDELARNVSRLSVSLLDEGPHETKYTNSEPKPSVSKVLSLKDNYFSQGGKHLSLEDEDVQVLDTGLSISKKNIEDEDVQVLDMRPSISKKNIEDEDVQVLDMRPSISKKHIVDEDVQVQDMQQPISTKNMEDEDVQILDIGSISKKSKGNSIEVLDNEMQNRVSTKDIVVSDATSSLCVFNDKKRGKSAEIVCPSGVAEIKISSSGSRKSLSKDFLQGNAAAYERVSPTSDSDKNGLNSKCQLNSSYSASHKSSKLKSINIENIEQPGGKDVLEALNRMKKDSVFDAIDATFQVAAKAPKQIDLARANISRPKRQVIQLQLPGENMSGNLHRLENEVKRFRLPRLDDWLKPILEIDFFVTVGLASVNEDCSVNMKLKEVPAGFQSSDEYINIFRPLVLEEFKAQLHNSFLEMPSSADMHCGSVSVLSVERVDDFHHVRCIHDDATGCGSCSENDLILLTRQPLKNTVLDIHLVGKVERMEKDNKRRLTSIVIKFSLQGGISRLNRARKLLNQRSRWYISRIMNMTPQLREFKALSSIKDVSLLPIILNPINHSQVYNDNKKPDMNKLPLALQTIFKSSYNDSQLKAITAVVEPLNSKEHELYLIQGPPGTGKTRTVLAIVSGLLALSSQRNGVNKRTLDVGSLHSKARARLCQSTAISRAWQDADLARQMNEEIVKKSNSLGRVSGGRVLICAQSNAAVDELVSRISCEGLHGVDGTKYKPYLVRVGNAKTIHPNSLPYFIDTLVEQRLTERRLSTSGAPNETNAISSTVLRSNLEKLVDRIRFYEAKRANLDHDNPDTKDRFGGGNLKVDDTKEMSDVQIGLRLRKLYEERKELYTCLSSAVQSEKKSYEEVKALKQMFRKSLLREAEIIVTTLSGCGGDLYGVCSESFLSHKSETILFDAIIIDEAAQALEPATLIPLQLLKSEGTKTIMVGDPKQLPATVISTIASKYSYQCSMFERMQKASYPVFMLLEQYRMHPEICKFPAMHFYDNKLLSGKNMSGKSAPFHDTDGLGPYIFYDITDGYEAHGNSAGSRSLYNDCEADCAIEILQFLRKRYPSEFAPRRIGIVTPYKSQLSLLRARVSSAFGSSIMAEMEFNTVDGFQGREVDIMILSTVRAAGTSSPATEPGSISIGFVADVRRMNVALTRAKLSMWILGNARTLKTNHNWAALVRDAKKRNMFLSVRKPYNSIFSSTLTKHSGRENVEYQSTKSASQQNAKGKICGKTKRYIVSEAEEANDKKKGGAQDNLSARDDPKSKAISINDIKTQKHVPSTVTGDGNKRDLNGSKLQNDNIRKGKKIDDTRGLIDNEKLVEQNYNTKKRKCEYIPRNPEQLTVDKQKTLNPLPSDSSSQSCKKKKKKNIDEPGVPPGQATDEVVESTTSNQVAVSRASMSKRKQQRDAVNALLSSSLISSKNTAVSLKPSHVKKPKPIKEAKLR
ncbi:helicase SEN1 isoform X2 [Impatiens glandulifera]|nr:helicase SEN1 isoform X2 [Impatiens glandulifera]